MPNDAARDIREVIAETIWGNGLLSGEPRTFAEFKSYFAQWPTNENDSPNPVEVVYEQTDRVIAALAAQADARFVAAADELISAAIVCEGWPDQQELVAEVRTKVLALHAAATRPVIVTQEALDCAEDAYDQWISDNNVLMDNQVGWAYCEQDALRAALEAFVNGGEGVG